ncbi:hypothetical protein ACTMUQ_13585 [Streptomyces sp. SD11]|uniref:hypothetical protein n=1 Tax=Streptomyces sp. SD11 TaxID=3452209 RepID=UPI003F8C6023
MVQDLRPMTGFRRHWHAVVDHLRVAGDLLCHCQDPGEIDAEVPAASLGAVCACPASGPGHRSSPTSASNASVYAARNDAAPAVNAARAWFTSASIKSAT